MFRKIFAVILSAACLLTTVCIPVSAEKKTDMRNITTMELVRDMGIGINLGNTMESCGDWIAKWGDGSVKSYETAWGSPVVTKKMIQGYANEGFGVLRIPVAWSNLMGKNYTINKDYMARVQQIVDWTLEADMYAIINIHYDGGWVNTFPENKKECMKRFTRFWEQISDNFKDYGDKLMFESQNEEFGWSSMYDQWDSSKKDKKGSFALVNEINQKFVDIVRKSGGNNPKRHLLISGYNTDIDKTCDPLFKMPSDPANRCAVSVHYYSPVNFAILEEDADWGKAESTWGTASDYKELEKQLDKMKTKFIDNGVPVIIGEYGCPTKNKEKESVVKFISSVCKEAYERQLCPVLWDVTDLHYDRSKCKMKNSELKKLLTAVPKGNNKNKSDKSTSSTVTKPTVKATATKNSVKLSWNDIEGAEKYSVYRVTNGKAKKIWTGKKTSVKIGKCKSDTKYQYVVRVMIDGKWTSIKTSDIVTVKTK